MGGGDGSSRRNNNRNKKWRSERHHHHASSSLTTENPPPPPCPSLPQHLQQLVAEALRRGVRLRLAPPVFEARRRNGGGTRYDGRTKKMLWHVEWRFLYYHDDTSSLSFPSHSSRPLSFVVREDRRVREDVPLGPLLRRHLLLGEPKQQEQQLQQQQEQKPLPRAFVAAAATAAAAAAPTTSLSSPSDPAPLPFRAFLRLDGRPANAPAWLEFSATMRSISSIDDKGEKPRQHEERQATPSSAASAASASFSFDETATLSELLRGRTVDEFPVVALVLASSSSSSSSSSATADANDPPPPLPLLPRGEIIAFTRPPRLPAAVAAAAPAPPAPASTPCL